MERTHVKHGDQVWCFLPGRAFEEEATVIGNVDHPSGTCCVALRDRTAGLTDDPICRVSLGDVRQRSDAAQDRNLLLVDVVGPPMSGKTGVAHALGRYLCDLGHETLVLDEACPSWAALPENEVKALERASSKGLLRVDVASPIDGFNDRTLVVVRTVMSPK